MEEVPKYMRKDIRWLDKTAELLDNRYRIPGTNIRFGIDFLVGLIPYAGDTITFFISGGLVIVMARQGVSGLALTKMIGNVFLDYLIGSIPILGDVFDITYKANLRNVNIARNHLAQGKHKGPVWPYILILLVLMILLFSLSIYLTLRFFNWLFG